MFKKIATVSAIMAISAIGVIGGLGFIDSASAATNAHQTPAQCTASVKWVMGQQVAAHVHSSKALRSNADALASYPGCNTLSPQMLNVVVGADKTVKADGAKIYTHWHNVK